MSRATLNEVLIPALREGKAVAGLVVLGWEDAQTYVEAAEAEGTPLILQAGPGFRKHMPIAVIAAMFNHLAEQAAVPVVTHLDHATTLDECRQAIEAGFSSIMYDGSNKPLSQKIDETARAVEIARGAGVTCEGEIGHVGYSQGVTGTPTDPGEAAKFASQTQVDALAISVGNVHLQTEKAAAIDFDAIQAIEAVTTVPLVLHGGSGISPEIRARLARETHVCKFNVGTELRMAFGSGLRETLEQAPDLFDRIEIMNRAGLSVKMEAQKILRELWRP
jgi:fructose-bisphosphate aldolase class II